MELPSNLSYKDQALTLEELHQQSPASKVNTPVNETPVAMMVQAVPVSVRERPTYCDKHETKTTSGRCKERLIWTAVLLVVVAVVIGVAVAVTSGGRGGDSNDPALVELTNTPTLSPTFLRGPTASPTTPAPTDGAAPLTHDTVWVRTQGLQNLRGPVSLHSFGQDVKLSRDGNTVAIGTFVPAVGSPTGYVRIFQWNTTRTEWVQKGSDVLPSPEGRRHGNFIDLSADGHTVAVGSSEAAAGIEDGTIPGQITIFRWDHNTNEWQAPGDPVVGNGLRTSSVAMSANGNRIVMGRSSGEAIRIFDFTGIEWEQVGSEIIGPEASELGESVAISDDGNIIAAGGGGFSCAGVFRGSVLLAIGSRLDTALGVSIFRYNSGTDLFEEAGSITAGVGEAGLGTAVALDGGGDALIVSADDELGVGTVGVYQYNESNEWTPVGSVLYSEDPDNAADWGQSVAISGTGRTIAVGQPGYSTNPVLGTGRDAGRVVIYRASP